MPRGYTGAFRSVKDVRLVICLAEPGNPKKGKEYHDVSVGADALIERIADGVANLDFHGQELS